MNFIESWLLPFLRYIYLIRAYQTQVHPHCHTMTLGECKEDVVLENESSYQTIKRRVIAGQLSIYVDQVSRTKTAISINVKIFLNLRDVAKAKEL